MKNLFILTISILLITSCAKSDNDDDDSYSSSTSGNNSDSSNISDNATTFTVTVSYGKYYLDGVSTKSIKLKKGNTYYFDLSHSSTNSHPFLLVHPLMGAIIMMSTPLELQILEKLWAF